MELQLNKPIFRDITLRGISEELKEKRQAEFVISTESVDNHGTVFLASGWKLDRYNQNPIVMYGHAHTSEDPNAIIGTGEVFLEDNKLIGRVTFEPGDINPKAETLWRKVQNNTIRMASVGAIPQEGHWGIKEAGEDPDVLYFTRQDLLEWSIVPIGSNRDALKRNAEALNEIKNTITRDIEVVQPETIIPEPKKLLSIREAQLIINKSKSEQ